MLHNDFYGHILDPILHFDTLDTNMQQYSHYQSLCKYAVYICILYPLMMKFSLMLSFLES